MHPEVLQKLLKDPVVQECRLRGVGEEEADGGLISGTLDKKGIPNFLGKTQPAVAAPPGINSTDTNLYWSQREAIT